jgi:hypothetical protein
MKPIKPRRYGNPAKPPEPMTSEQREIMSFVCGMMFAIALELFFRGIGS